MYGVIQINQTRSWLEITFHYRNKKICDRIYKNKTNHKYFGFIIHETTFEDNTSMAKNNEVIEKSVKSLKSNNIATTTTSTSPFISLAKISEVVWNKYIKSPELTPIKKDKRKNMNNVEVDTNVDNEKNMIIYY